MQRWLSAIVGTVLVAFGAHAPAAAQTSLIGGGLTAQPTVTLAPNQLLNGGFETLNGGAPANWGTGSGWAMDQITKHSGTFSYRRGAGAPTVVQTIALKKGTYKLSGWVKTEGLGSGTTSGMRLMFDLRPTVNAWNPSDVISGTTDWKFMELKNLIVTQDQTVRITLENYNGAGGTAWWDDLKLEQQLPQFVDVFMLYPNYRGMLFAEGPTTMRFDVAVTPPAGDFGRYKIRGAVKDEATGQVVTTKDFTAAASIRADLDGGQMQMSRPYLVTFSLVDLSNGASVYTYPAYRVSRVPAGVRGGMNIAFDDKNRVLMKGTPRFVLGVYDSGSSYSTNDAFWENQLWSPTGERRMDNLKINMYLNYWYGAAPVEAMNALMSNLAKHGVMYLQTGNCFDKFPAGGDFQINASDSYVQQFGAHPASAGYYTIDECISTMQPGAFQQYDRLRRLDPDSMTFAALFGNPDLVLWRDSADIISTDPYPLFAAEPAGGYNHRFVADWTINTRNALKDSRPYMTVLQFFKFTSQGRWPTRQEMRNHAYMAITEGARGLWWWSLGDNALLATCSGWCAEKTNHMNDLKAVVNEIAALEAPLLTDDATTALKGNSNGNAIKTKVKIHNGKGYLFAYNGTNTTQSATFTWNVAPGTVTVNGENRTLGASGSSFTDSFGPFQAHVYVIGNGGTGTGGGDTGGGDTGGGGTGGGGTPTAPTVSFTNPAASTTSVSGTVTVTLAGSGGSGSGYTYKLAVDGTNVYTGTNPSFSWNTTTVASGSHTVLATVTDGAGQSGTASRTLTVSNGTTPPPPTGGLQVFVTQPTNGTTVTGTHWAVLWVNGAGAGNKTYTLTSGGQTVGTSTTTSVGPVAIPWDTRKVVDGPQTLTATAQDAAGKTGSASVSVNVKNGITTAPLTLGFSSPATGATVNGTVTVALAAAGGTGPYTYTLGIDSAAPSTVSSSSAWNTTTVGNGSHTLTATVRDSAGRSATATRTVTVSSVTATPLTAAITAPTATTVSGTVTVTAAGNGGAGLSYTLAVDGVQVATTASFSWNTTAVANGSHTLTATVRDSAGRTATATKTVTVSNTVTTPPPTGGLQVAVTQPSGGATVSGTHWAIVWVSGATGTSTYTLTAGGKTVGSGAATGNPASIPWDTTAVADGTQTLTVSVRDGAGKTGSVNVSVTVRNGTTTPPPPTGSLQVAVTQPTAGATVRGTAWVVVWVNGASGTSTVTLTVNGVTVGTGSGNGGPISIPWTTSVSGNGARTVTVSARDTSGNTGSKTVNVTVAN